MRNAKTPLRTVMNYVYSVFKRSLTTSSGTNSFIQIQVFTLFILFGIGGLLNLLGCYWYTDLKNLFFGVFMAVVIAVGWIIVPGYKYLESVKSYSDIQAHVITVIILSVSTAVFLLPAYILAEIKSV